MPGRPFRAPCVDAARGLTIRTRTRGAAGESALKERVRAPRRKSICRPTPLEARGPRPAGVGRPGARPCRVRGSDLASHRRWTRAPILPRASRRLEPAGDHLGGRPRGARPFRPGAASEPISAPADRRRTHRRRRRLRPSGLSRAPPPDAGRLQYVVRECHTMRSLRLSFETLPVSVRRSLTLVAGCSITRNRSRIW
jgi:hypothetical protein